MKKFNVILATDLNGGFGLNGKLPWNIEKDHLFFKTVTKQTNILPGINRINNILIAGRKTFESMQSKPLPNRKIFVISSDWKNLSDTNTNDQISFFPTFFSAYLNASESTLANIWVIGGCEIYNSALRHWACDQVFWTKINGIFNTDVSIDMNKYLIDWTNTIIESDIDKNTGLQYNIEFKQGTIVPNIESFYLHTLYDVIKSGEKRQTRNAITFSKFTKTISCDLTNGFPLLTTKKMFWKGVVEELLFFIRGETNTSSLSEKGVKIWEPNTNQEFLDKLGFDYLVGEMGPMYGYQWRHFNKPYPFNNDQPVSQGIDQLVKIINEIKTDPHSRRILMTDFNPSQVNQGVLYPCHSIVIQFYVQDTKLSCTMYQRSVDLFLGAPFNIASTALLIHIIGKLTGLEPGIMNLIFGDYHIYSNHVNKVYEQLERTPYDLPQIQLPNFETIEQVENSSFEDYTIVNYQSHPAIKAQMIA